MIVLEASSINELICFVESPGEGLVEKLLKSSTGQKTRNLGAGIGATHRHARNTRCDIFCRMVWCVPLAEHITVFLSIQASLCFLALEHSLLIGPSLRSTQFEISVSNYT